MSALPISAETVIRLLRQLPPRERLRVLSQVLPELEGDLPEGPAAPDFWRGADLQILVASQGVHPVKDFRALLGGWPQDESIDDFIATNRRDLEHEQHEGKRSDTKREEREGLCRVLRACVSSPTSRLRIPKRRFTRDIQDVVEYATVKENCLPIRTSNADQRERIPRRIQMQSTGCLRSHAWTLVSIAFALASLLLGGCEPSDQRAVETAVANAAQTAVAAGKQQAATQVIIVKDTAVASAATEAAKLKMTAEAEIATRIAPQRPAVKPEVQAARDKLKAMGAMQSHWKQVTAPLQNAPGERNADSYADAIDQFDVASSELAGRYQAGGSGNADTRCNIFAGDVMRAMGVPLPTKGNLGKGQGDPNATYTDPMTAQAPLLNDYLNRKLRWVTSPTDKGILSDWVEIKPDTPASLSQLIAHVNAGKPALVSDTGHIAVIRPSQSAVQSWQELIIAQAGASNFLYGALKGHFSGTPQFFLHD